MSVKNPILLAAEEAEEIRSFLEEEYIDVAVEIRILVDDCYDDPGDSEWLSTRIEKLEEKRLNLGMLASLVGGLSDNVNIEIYNRCY